MFCQQYVVILSPFFLLFLSNVTQLARKKLIHMLVIIIQYTLNVCQLRVSINYHLIKFKQLNLFLRYGIFCQKYVVILSPFSSLFLSDVTHLAREKIINMFVLVALFTLNAYQLELALIIT